MIGLETIILGALVVAELLYVAYIAFLFYTEVVEWFEARSHKVNYDDVGFTVAKAIENGNHKVVQGVFNRSTNKVKFGRNLNKVGEMDYRLRELHRGSPVVLYD